MLSGTQQFFVNFSASFSVIENTCEIKHDDIEKKKLKAKIHFSHKASYFIDGY